MRALVIDQAQGVPAVNDVERPSPPPGGAVIRVEATGLCRSDWHAWAGHDDGVAFPHVPGHELAGVVVETAPEVKSWQAGDRVTAPFICGCGQCSWCLQGDAQVCPDQQQPGFTHWGSFAEYVVLHAADTNLIAVPDGVSMAAAAALGCRFATAYRALVGRAAVQPGEWVTVIGAGGVGLSTVMIAKALGARTIAVDRHRGALDAASGLGADHVLLAEGQDIPAAVSALTDGGSHVAVDAVGSEQTSADAALSLRRRGRHVQVGLLAPTGGHPRIPLDRAIAWELDILGSHGMAAADYPAMLELIARGELAPQRLIERTVGLEQAAEMLPTFDTATVAGITVIDPRERGLEA
ncbi:zinc-dependent alcohol dehydrogenase family protein [Nesterenkonia sp. NBAIMH1]|uniref:zinc-dependent alcohol dehydrogenase family protein n=1 Tax=Nesterenkonia sp. NBAIMH1 TaxID=2600320 RepID=UPI0011B358BB|nr:zinc-dependent alcohol dehydrogenase family protein [Nesterenkonia sp. NBAIMH1]